MLYYVQHCRNECHVVVTSVTPGRDIAMQGHSQAARPAVLGWWSQVSVPRWAVPKTYIPNHPTGASALNPTGCQHHQGSQCQQAGWLGTSESPKNILGYTSCPLSYPHWSLWWSQAERDWGQQWKGWVATLAKPCCATPCWLQDRRLALRVNADLCPKGGCKYSEVSRSFCQGVQWAPGCISYRNDFGKVSLQSDTRTYN